jgi:hypothetical protein
MVLKNDNQLRLSISDIRHVTAGWHHLMWKCATKRICLIFIHNVITYRSSFVLSLKVLSNNICIFCLISSFEVQIIYRYIIYSKHIQRLHFFIHLSKTPFCFRENILKGYRMWVIDITLCDMSLTLRCVTCHWHYVVWHVIDITFCDMSLTLRSVTCHWHYIPWQVMSMTLVL